MLTAGQTTNVTFAVNVMGTQTEPKVRVVLGGAPEISFAATCVDGKWSVPMNIPSSLPPGSYDLRVEVLLNNRLFTPINKKVEVQMSIDDVRVNEPVPASSPVQDNIAASIPEQPIVVRKMPEPMLKSFANVQEQNVPKSLSKLSETISKPKRRYRVESLMPKPSNVKPEVVKVKISEIDAVTSKTVSKIVNTVVEAKLPKSKPRKSSTLIQLVKEELFYE